MKKMKEMKNNKRFKFTASQLEELRRDYPFTHSAELAARFGCSLRAIYNAAHRYNIKKDTEFIGDLARRQMMNPDHPARKHWIKKGNTPANKGKKQTDYMSPEAIEKTKSTRFRKGQLPRNTLYDHAITRRQGKNGRTYQWIRTGLAKWVPYHRYLWEQTYGQIPKGYNIQFRDGNTLNCTLENLYMVNRSEQLKNENSFYARYPEEVQKLIQLKGALNRQINNANKKNTAHGSTRET